MLVNETDGHWAKQYGFSVAPGQPALFLDRDGVIVEEVHFLSRVEDIRLEPGMADAIASVNRRGLPVVVVTNQSGVGRGLFDWKAFEAVNDAINAQLAQLGAHLDAVFACGGSGLDTRPEADDRRDWRKPGAGMLMAARDMFEPDMARSVIVGDRVTDLWAGANAGIGGGWLVMTGYGQQHRERFHLEFADPAHPFAARTADTPVEAVRQFLAGLD